MTPALPPDIGKLSMKNIAIGDGHLNLTVSRTNGVTQLQVDDNPDGLNITLQPLAQRPPEDASDRERHGVMAAAGVAIGDAVEVERR